MLTRVDTDTETFLDSVNAICRPFPETLLCEPVRVDSGWLPVFFVVENRPPFGHPADTASYVLSVMQSPRALVPFLLVRIGDAIYDWWLNIWGPGGREILEGLIAHDEVPLFFVSTPTKVISLYPLENNWRDLLQRVRDAAGRRKPWTMTDTAAVKFAVMVRFGSKLNFWYDIVQSAGGPG